MSAYATALKESSKEAILAEALRLHDQVAALEVQLAAAKCVEGEWYDKLQAADENEAVLEAELKTARVVAADALAFVTTVRDMVQKMQRLDNRLFNVVMESKGEEGW